MRHRTGILRVVVLLGLIAMAGRLAWFQVVKADEVIAREEAWRLQQAALTPVRGALKDRSGRYLAVSIPTRDVVASPYHMKEKYFAEVATALAPLLGMKAEDLEAQFREKESSQYLPLAKGIDLETAAKIEELNLRGISLQSNAKRTYPQGSVANQVIGYLDFDGTGLYGLEAQYDKELKGQSGYVQAELTHDGTPIDGTIKNQVEAEPGLDLTLTLDARLQQIFDATLDKAVKETEAKRALAIAMDIKTGEILALSMRPGADLSDRKSWLTASGEPDFGRINNWAVEPLPPGSIFKTITTSIALEEGLIDVNTLIPDSGRMVIDGATITNWDQVVPVAPKPMTIAELLQASSNVGLINVGERIPHETFIKYLESFGFMGTTGLDFNHESGANGLVNFEDKKRIDWANMYIGQHLEVTPLQMVRAVGAIANGGIPVTPHLVKEMRKPDGQLVWSAETKTGSKIISSQTAKEVQQLMVSVIDEHYQQAKVDGYSAGGKTGTAQKFENGREKARGLGDFIGFAPASDPRIVMMILIDEPKPPGYGGVVAAPLFSQLMPHALRLLGVAPDRPVQSKAAPAQASAAPATVAVPDVRFLPVAWAEQKLKDAGLAPQRAGAAGGTLVTAQSVAVGAAVKPGSTVVLTLGPKAADKVQLPDFRGLTLAEANRLAAEVGVTLKQKDGTGFVVEQSPAAGGVVAPGGVVTVRLSTARTGQ